MDINDADLLPPKKTPLDLITSTMRNTVASTAVTIASAITDPITGTFLSSLIYDFFKDVFPSTFDQRYSSWQENISRTVLKLKKDVKDIQAHLQSDFFKTFFIKATAIAIGNHQQEKIETVRNMVINNILGINIKEDIQLILLDYVNTLTLSHFHLLFFISENLEQLSKIESYTELWEKYESSGHSINKDIFKTLLLHLTQEKNLIQLSPAIDDFKAVYENTHMITETGKNSNLPMLRITDIGQKFIEFITLEHSELFE